MNKFSGIIQSIRTATTKHSPEILTGLGIAGMITTTIMAVRATPKALTLIKDAKYTMTESTKSIPNILSKKDIIKTTWKCYLPAGITGVLSIACIIGGQKESVRRSAAFATAYSISENALKTYQQKVIETIGEKKEILVRDAVAREQVENSQINKREIIITEKGNTLCLDSITNQPFRSDKGTIEKIENEINRRLRSEMFISLNDFYSELGIKHSVMGYDIGWNVDEGFEISFSSQITDDGTPCLVLNYPVIPRYDR